MLYGSETPRLFTEPLRELTPETSLGFEACDFIECYLEITLLPWQRWWLIHALELLPDGRFRFRTILTLVGRQNGKTELLKCLALYFLFEGKAKLVLGAAQSLDMAREAWEKAVDAASESADLSAMIPAKGGVRRTNGEQELKLDTGARYRIRAATRSAARGLSVDLLILDELREHRTEEAWAALSKTTLARPKALICAISNAGDIESVVLNNLRKGALAGKDSRLGIFEWSAPDDCNLDDRQAWAQAMPALGHIVSEEDIVSSLATDSPAVFRTEILCQFVDSMADMAVAEIDWAACQDKRLTFKDMGRVGCIGIDVSPDLLHATLVAAAVGTDGRVLVKPVKAWDAQELKVRAVTDLLLAELPALLAELKPRKVAWFPGGPTDALRVPLEKLSNAAGLSGADAASSCQAFAEQVTTRAVLHDGDPLLTAHVLGAKKFARGDGWVFVRKGTGHVDAAYAAAGAVQMARAIPVRRAVVLVSRAS